MTSISLHDAQTQDIAEARQEFEFRSRQLFDRSYDRLADLPPNRLREDAVTRKYIEARDAYLALVGAL